MDSKKKKSEKVQLSNCTVYNDIKDMPETLGLTHEKASMEALKSVVPLTLLQRFWFCRSINVFRCDDTKCIAHIDYKEE